MNPRSSSKKANPPSGRSIRPLELATLIHLGLFLILASWGFGGNSPWSRLAVSWWGSLGIFITVAAFMGREARLEGRRRMLRWLWPFALLNVIVLASILNPNFRELKLDGEVLFAKAGGLASLPGSARPQFAGRALWLFDGIFLSCFNLALLVRRRRSLRGLLLVAAANALALAVFGTVQKFMGASGLYFGLVKPPQAYFFASFIYHNHWGAFTVLMTALCLGLAAYYARHSPRDFWHSPAFGGLVAVFFLAASIPLSTSRSCTLLVLALLAGAFLHWIVRTARLRLALKKSIAPPLLAGCFAVLAAGGIAYKLAEPVIRQRVAKTVEQLAEMQARGGLGSRATLYRDTWHMARDRLLFGWGMASYPTVFYLYNTQEPGIDRLPVFYYDAHSDWLQSLAELGLVGTLLLGLHGVVPLLSLRRRGRPGPLPCYLFAGCGLILLYAWIEFPFGNPAVVLAWWLCFFIGVRYARLDSHAEDS